MSTEFNPHVRRDLERAAAASEVRDSQASNSDKKLPIKAWRLGASQVAAYRDSFTADNGDLRTTIKITFGKRIRNQDGSFQTVRSLYPQDIGPMVALLQEAQSWVLQQSPDESF